jgi:hypothetical protein
MPPDFVSSGGPVEKVIWPAGTANAVNRIRDEKNFVFGFTRGGTLIPLEEPISQPGGSIDQSLGDVKDGWKAHFFNFLFDLTSDDAANYHS